MTGGYAGIGLETTRALAAAGAAVIVPARDLAKAREAIGGLSNVSIEPLDLAAPATIDAFATRHADRPLHLLINNAGIMAVPLSRDARGLESQLAMNHVGHFQLFARLVAGAEARQRRPRRLRCRRAVMCAPRSTSKTRASSTARTTR